MTQQIITLNVEDVVFDETIYPRLRVDAAKVQQYAEGGLDVLPEIEVDQKYRVIDGVHRLMAHKKAGAKTIQVFVTETRNDGHALELAIQRNHAHGLQLSLEEKKKCARDIYRDTPIDEQGPKKEYLRQLLSVTAKTVYNWLSRIDKDNKEFRDAEVFNLWLGNRTQNEISEAVGIPRQTIGELLPELATFQIPAKPEDFPENAAEGDTLEQAKKKEEERRGRIRQTQQDAASHASDFRVPIYNIWKQQEKTTGSSHFGNSESRWVDNLLYLYTKPFDVVVDPFAGGGSTIDVCKKRFRRHFVSDRKPIVEREKDIRKHDLTEGLPPIHNWKDVKLVYLDPPYWKQAEGQYSDDPSDLANMSLDEFNKSLSGIIKAFSKKLTDAWIALIIQPTQWNAPERQFTDHVGDMLRLVALPVDMRFSVPYESQQGNAQMVQWAQQNKRCLVLTREIVVWKV